MSNSADLGTSTAGSTSPYNGYSSNFGFNDVTKSQVTQGNASLPYEGYDTNFGALVAQNTNNGAKDQSYTGFITTYGANVSIGVTEATQLDNNMVYPYPKDQQIYYKLRGFNSNTSLYETWIIVEEIVPRPEVFDPTRNPPNVDLNVFFSPPSGHTLSNIRIVGRWIQ